MTTLYEFTGQLIVVRCWCGIQYAIPQSLRDEQIRQKEIGSTQTRIYCPLGHTWISIDSETPAQREARQFREARDRLQAHLDQKSAELRDAKNALNATKAAKSRLKNRIKNGICPCCNRHFENLAKHMKSRHPEEFTEPNGATQ